jgi:hypothetical protein
VALLGYPSRTSICEYRLEYYKKSESKCWFESCETQLIEELRGVSRSDNFEYFFGHVLQGTRILKGGVLPLSMGVDIHGWWLIAGKNRLFDAVISLAVQNILSIGDIFWRTGHQRR